MESDFQELVIKDVEQPAAIIPMNARAVISHFMVLGYNQIYPEPAAQKMILLSKGPDSCQFQCVKNKFVQPNDCMYICN